MEDGHLHTAREEYKEQTDAAADGDVEFEHHADGQEQHNKVGQDIGHAAALGEGNEVEAAAAGDELVPDVFKRNALEEGGDGEGEPGGEDEDEEGPGGDSLPAVGEDAKVEEDDAQFGEGAGGEVEKFFGGYAAGERAVSCGWE